MWNIKRAIALTFVVLVGGITAAYAQTGTIRGVVTDAGTGDPLIGVNVGLLGTSIGAPTGIDGDYRINRVPAGTYTLAATSIGYRNFQVQIEVVAGETLELNIVMNQEAVQGEEVVISAQAQGQREAINQQLQSDKIVSVVSETKIQELPDFNAAAALGRLPGVSTTRSSGEDNKVIIRGLSPEYNSIEIEGTRLASTGSSSIGFTSDFNVTTGGVNNDRSVDLTSVSPYMIRMISVYKSLTPDMNANSIGGTVNMELREAPAEPHFDALFQGGYTAKSNNYGNYRAVVSGSDRFLNNKFGLYVLGNVESYDRNADNMSANYTVWDLRVPEDGSFRPVIVNNVTFNRHIETRNRYGGNVILDYRLPQGSLKFLNMYTRINSDYIDYNQNLAYGNRGMSWRMQQAENTIDQQLHSLKLDYDLGWINMDLSASYTAAHNQLEDSPVINFNYPSSIVINQDSLILNKTPDELLDYQQSFNSIDNIILRSANLFSSDYKEERFTYKADFEVPFNLGTAVSGAFKFGGQWDQQSNSLDQGAPYVAFDGNVSGDTSGVNISNRMMFDLMNEFNIGTNSQGVFTAPRFETTDNDLYNSFLDNQFGGIYFTPDPGILVDMVYFVLGDPKYDATNEQSTGRNGGWYDGPYQKFINDYSFEEDYYATYAMTQFTVGDFFVIGGARYERVESHYTAYNAEDKRNVRTQIMLDTTSTSTNEFLLPMGQVKYTPFDWMDIRYAYTQTLARPSYHLLSPKFNIPNSGSGAISAGNPDLKPAKSYNHDVSLSFHANKLGLISVGGFYKTIENFVYTASYFLDVAEAAGIDQASNYIVRWNDALRERLVDEYPFIVDENGNPVPGAGYENGDEIMGPTATNGAYIVPVRKPLNNPNNATVRGLELDFQHNFWYLPAPFNGTVFGVNYTRIFSEYTQPIYDRVRIPGTRPAEYELADSSFTGRLSNQSNHVLNTYIGFDYKGFSGRFSVLFQSNQAGAGNGRFPENDVWTDDFLKLDFSARQKLPLLDGKTELFMDVSNLNSANSEFRQRSLNGFQRVENYGLTANLGIRIRY